MQAETMVKSAKEKYDQCLKAAESETPATVPFVENVNKCVKSLENEESVTEEADSSNSVNN